MNLRNMFGLSAIATLGVALLPDSTVGQQRTLVQQLVGMPAMIVLVRHGETARGTGNEPILTAAGHERAKELAEALRNVKLSAILTTQLIRTHETAQPLATAQGLAPTVVNFDPSKAGEYATTAKQEIQKHAGGAVLVVGHQRSIPPLIAAYGGPPLPIICEHRFGNMFVLTPANSGKAYVVHSQYGAPGAPPAADCM